MIEVEHVGWRFDPIGYEDSPAIVRVLVGGDSEPIAIPIDSGFAYVELMAAAPDLLAVLQQIADDVEEWSDSGNSELFHERMHANAEDARTAISKAKGGVL